MNGRATAQYLHMRYVGHNQRLGDALVAWCVQMESQIATATAGVKRPRGTSVKTLSTAPAAGLPTS